MSDFSLGRTNLNFYVVAQPRKAVHKFALGQVGEVAAHHVRDFGLGDAHPFGSLLLSQTKAFHCFPDFDHQARFDLEFFSIGEA